MDELGQVSEAVEHSDTGCVFLVGVPIVVILWILMHA